MGIEDQNFCPVGLMRGKDSAGTHGILDDYQVIRHIFPTIPHRITGIQGGIWKITGAPVPSECSVSQLVIPGKILVLKVLQLGKNDLLRPLYLILEILKM